MSTLIIAVSAVVGQLDESGSTREYLKDLQCFVGEWKFEGDDAGDKVTGETKAEWINDKSFLLVRSVTKRPDGTTMHYTEVVGWDPVKKQMRSWGFGGLGGYGQTIWTKNGNKWTMKSDGPWIRWNGDKLTGTTVRQIIDEDTFVEEGTYKFDDAVLTARMKSTRVK